MKKRIFLLLDTVLAGLLFFFISYAFFEYTMNSSNGALVTGGATTVLFCIAYFTLRQGQKQKQEEKEARKAARQALALQLQWMQPEAFRSWLLSLLKLEYDFLGRSNGYILFQTRNGPVTFLLDNSPTGPDTQDILHWIKDASVSACSYVLVSVNPPDEKCRQLLEMLRTKVLLRGTEDIQSLMEKHNIALPQEPLLAQPRHQPLYRRMFAFFQSRYAAGFAFKYGMLLFACSLFSHYRAYYICCGGLLLAMGFASLFYRRRLQSRKIF